MFRLLTTLFVALALVASAADAQTSGGSSVGITRPIGGSDPADIRKIEVLFCVASVDMVPPPGAGSVFSGLKRLTYNGYRQARIDIDFNISADAGCAQKAGNGCYGTPGKVYCNLLALSNVLDRMAWVSASGVLGMVKNAEKSKDGLRFETQVNWERASELAELFATPRSDAETVKGIERIVGRQVSVDDVLEAAIVRAQLLLFDGGSTASIERLGREATIAYPIFEGGVNYLFAYVFGHEFAHAYRGCVHRVPSREEEMGRFTAIVRAQGDGKTFTPNPLLLDEALADRCGLRGVQAVDREMIAFKTERAGAESMLSLMTASRRLAIDALSNVMATGLGRRWSEGVTWIAPGTDGLPTTQYKMEVKPGYLFPPLRMALFTDLLHGLDTSNPAVVRLCDGSAQIFVLGLNLAKRDVQRDTSKPSRIDQTGLPALFGDVVGSGVVEGWRTGRWDSRTSFACQ